jgi:hypothetical protein
MDLMVLAYHPIATAILMDLMVLTYQPIAIAILLDMMVLTYLSPYSDRYILRITATNEYWDNPMNMVLGLMKN